MTLTVQHMYKKVKIVELLLSTLKCDRNQLVITDEGATYIHLRLILPNTSPITFAFRNLTLEQNFEGILEADNYTRHNFKTYDEMVKAIESSLNKIKSKLEPTYKKYMFIYNLDLKGDKDGTKST